MKLKKILKEFRMLGVVGTPVTNKMDSKSKPVKEAQWDSKAQKDVNIAKAKFSNAILDADPKKILQTYKDLEKPVIAYIKQINIDDRPNK